MSGLLPTSKKICQLVADYTADSRKIVEKCLTDADSCAAFEEVYELSLATDTVLKGLSTPSLRPSLHPARNVVVRVPLLVGVGQSSVAEGELRRFVELILWALFFTDHPIEWRSFHTKTTGGFTQDARKPISHAARRELSFYLEYAHELMEGEPSGLGVKAVENVKQAVKKLNAAVHAGHLARQVRKVPPHDDISEPAVRDFAKIQRQTFSSCCLLLAAYRRLKFNSLGAMSRAYFDWLIGPKLRRDVRKGPFGLT